ncbi:MAG: cupin domain-containing protein [Candidatus Limnocylindrales bacterium]
MTSGSLLARLAAEGLVAQAWSNGPGDVYRAHDHDYDKVIVVAEGSIVFGLPGSGQRLLLETGDRLELPAGTAHDASVGSVGVTCLEAHRPAGSLPAGSRRRPAGDW